MKKLMLLCCVVLSFSIAQAQTITELDEVKIGFTPLGAKVYQNGNQFTYSIKKANAAEFIQNPIGFMYDNFDIKNFIASVDEDYDYYSLKINSTKGSMLAKFNRHGDLIKTIQGFQDILLPLEVRGKVYKDNNGWTMVKNKFSGITDGEILRKEVYKVWLEKGDLRKTVKLKGSNDGISVASLN